MSQINPRGRKLEYFKKQKCFEKYSIEDPFNANEQDKPLNAHHLKKELRKWFFFVKRFLTSRDFAYAKRKFSSHSKPDIFNFENAGKL